MKREIFGTIDGREVYLFTLQNDNIKVDITNYGATLVRILVPDKDGVFTDVLLGYDTLEDYRRENCYMGALVGRCANRILAGETVLPEMPGTIGKSVSGKPPGTAAASFVLEANDGPNFLHSGKGSTAFQIWEIEEESCDETHLVFTLVDKEIEGGLPGNVSFRLCYELLKEGGLRIYLTGTSDKTTVMNVTSHGYFHLGGQGSGTVEKHRLQIFAENYTPLLSASHTPDGSVRPVAGTKYDFREMREIGAEAYDDNYVLKGRLAAEAFYPATGIGMKLFTNTPCMQFYTGKFISPQKGKDGREYGSFSGFCLEPQYAPDAIHCREFVQPVFEKGEPYQFETVLQFYRAENTKDSI